MSEKIWDAKNLTLFEGLNPTESHALLKFSERLRCGRGVPICRQGDETRELYIVLGGSVEVRTEERGVLAVYGPNEMVGEVGFLTGLPRTASVVAREDSLLLSISSRALEAAEQEFPGITPRVLNNMTIGLGLKLIDANRRIDELTGQLRLTAARVRELEGALAEREIRGGPNNVGSGDGDGRC